MSVFVRWWPAPFSCDAHYVRGPTQFVQSSQQVPLAEPIPHLRAAVRRQRRPRLPRRAPLLHGDPASEQRAEQPILAFMAKAWLPAFVPQLGSSRVRAMLSLLGLHPPPTPIHIHALRIHSYASSPMLASATPSCLGRLLESQGVSLCHRGTSTYHVSSRCG